METFSGGSEKRGQKIFHVRCKNVQEGRNLDIADVVAYLRAWPMRTSGGLAISIEKGKHVGAAGKVKS